MQDTMFYHMVTSCDLGLGLCVHKGKKFRPGTTAGQFLAEQALNMEKGLPEPEHLVQLRLVDEWLRRECNTSVRGLQHAGEPFRKARVEPAHLLKIAPMITRAKLEAWLETRSLDLRKKGQVFLRVLARWEEDEAQTPTCWTFRTFRRL